MSWADEIQLREEKDALILENNRLRLRLVEISEIEIRKWALSLSAGDILEAEKYVGYVTNGLS